MPYFLNVPITKNSFTEVAGYKYFVDKSGLIGKMNECMNTPNKYVCITRPRRFGKTLNAMMLASYYSKSANSKNIFDNLQISKDKSYLEHLNKHNVIYMTLNQLPSPNCSYKEFINRYISMIYDDLKEQYNVTINDNMVVSDVFNAVYNQTGKGFVFILDEWDYIFNNSLFSENDRKSFLKFLEDLLKDKSYVDLAYMTGVLPIAKYSTSSTINMFDEYTFLNDEDFDIYFGFTENEVEKLCSQQNKVSMNELKTWYNGYITPGGHEIYNPRSVAFALRKGRCQSYWTNTGPMDEIIYYINNDVGAVKDDIVSMVSGIPLEIKLKGYSAEQKELNTRNQILSAMTIYGFLSYHDKTLEIPNKELRIKFDEALEDKSMGEVSKLVLKSNEMLKATLRKDTETMVKILEEAHDINIPVIKYNDENSLSCVVMLSYLSARDEYTIIREMPSGKGFADFIFYPNDKSKPAFILELKKNSTPEEALKQIREKKYALALKNYTGKKFAVGISWNKKTKEHKIKIEDII